MDRDVLEPKSSPESEPIASFFISFAIPELDAGLRLREEMMLIASASGNGIS